MAKNVFCAPSTSTSRDRKFGAGTWGHLKQGQCWLHCSRTTPSKQRWKEVQIASVFNVVSWEFIKIRFSCTGFGNLVRSGPKKQISQTWFCHEFSLPPAQKQFEITSYNLASDTLVPFFKRQMTSNVLTAPLRYSVKDFWHLRTKINMY